MYFTEPAKDKFEKEAAVERANARHLHWVRLAPVHGQGQFSWRPRTWHRRATTKAVEMEDNVITVMTDMSLFRVVTFAFHPCQAVLEAVSCA